MDTTAGTNTSGNKTITSASPDIVDEATMEPCLSFIEGYRLDEKKDYLVCPKAGGLWQQLPEFLKTRVNEGYQSIELTNLVAAKEDMREFNQVWKTAPQFIGFETFKQLYTRFPTKFQNLFTPKLIFSKVFGQNEADYQKLPRDPLMKLYLQKQDMIGYLGGVCGFSRTKQGFLTFEELKSYLGYVLDCCGADITLNMKCVAAEIFAEMIIFRLDFVRMDQVAIADLFATDILPQIFAAGDYFNNEIFFSIPQLTNSYEQYMNECTGSGLIKDQMCSSFPSITKPFWDRYFDVNCPNGLMYFADFYKFIYCLENLTEFVVIKHLFKVFDVDGDGEITFNDIEYFHRDMMALMENVMNVEINDWYDQLYDMCLVKPPNGITVDDLIKSQQSKTFFGNLIDSNELKRFELQETGEPEEHFEDE